MSCYLSLEEVLYLHDLIIKKSGGSQGIRDLGLLLAALERPKVTFSGKDLYETIFSKAAALIHSLVLNHAFVDGNKRTAFACCLRFLEINGYRFKADFKELINFLLEIESKKIKMSGITSWLEKHSCII